MTKAGFVFTMRPNRDRKAPKLKFRDGELPPMKMSGGKYVTIEDCPTNRCHWPYGLPGPEMILCGRPGAPWCKEHRVLAFARKK